MWFASEGEIVAVRDFIVRRRTDPNCRDANGCTPLILSAAHGHTEVVAALLELRADVNAVATGGISPIISAAIGRHADTVGGIDWSVGAETANTLYYEYDRGTHSTTHARVCGCWLAERRN